MLRMLSSFALALAMIAWSPRMASAQACGSYTTHVVGNWYASLDTVESAAYTQRSSFWALYCGGGMQTEVWLSYGYSGYGVDSTTGTYVAAQFQRGTSYSGTHLANSKHWYIAPNYQWHLILNDVDSFYAEAACQPPPGGCPIEGSVWDPVACECTEGCPLLLDTDDDGFELTDHSGGVLFDLNSDGQKERVSWTKAGSDDGWLVLDRNGNGVVDNGSELFGNFTSIHSTGDVPLALDGFQALRGSEGPTWGPSVPDGVIDQRDAVYSQLQIWRDSNHDGVSQPNELASLPSLGLVKLDTNFKITRRLDEHGNSFRLRAPSYWLQEDGKIKRRLFYDVWLLLQ